MNGWFGRGSWGAGTAVLQRWTRGAAPAPVASEPVRTEGPSELERVRAQLGECEAQLEAAQARQDLTERMVSADRLARGLTHEINNPLAILLANLDFASDELKEPGEAAGGGSREEVLEALGEARQAGRRISLIVRELMTIAKGQSNLDQGPADLVVAIEHARRLAEPELRRHASFHVELPAGPVLVQGGQARLGQLFLELLLGASSAIAGAGGSGGRVTLVLRPEPGGALVEISDDGLPIPPELMPRLFDPFFTPVAGFAAGSAGLRGAGMGMASCFGIVQAAGGRLSVESAPGTGTVFRVWLPAPGTQSRVVLVDRDGALGRRRPRALVIDPDPFECAMAYRELASHFHVAPHTSVSSALAVTRAGERFDVILCDTAAGGELLAALSADRSSLRDRVVLVWSGTAPPPVADLKRLQRPVAVDEVLALVGRPSRMGESRGD
jgi:signal transduction histidine kinase